MDALPTGRDCVNGSIVNEKHEQFFCFNINHPRRYIITYNRTLQKN